MPIAIRPEAQMHAHDTRPDPVPFIDRLQLAALAAAPKPAPGAALPQPTFRWGSTA